jgi:hypothetical protein
LFPTFVLYTTRSIAFHSQVPVQRRLPQHAPPITRFPHDEKLGVVQVLGERGVDVFTERGEEFVTAGHGFAVGFDEGVGGCNPLGGGVCVPALFVDGVGVCFPVWGGLGIRFGVGLWGRIDLHPFHAFVLAGFVVPGACVDEGGLGGVRHVGS